ncbi:MAG TPA: hypothetical protein V6D33_13360 [Cyanophyceae cyanobacterium]
MANYNSLHGFCNSLNDYYSQDDVDQTQLNPWQDIIIGSTVRGSALNLECFEDGDGSWIKFDEIKGQVFFSQQLNEWVVTSDAEDFSHEHEF